MKVQHKIVLKKHTFATVFWTFWGGSLAELEGKRLVLNAVCCDLQEKQVLSTVV